MRLENCITLNASHNFFPPRLAHGAARGAAFLPRLGRENPCRPGGATAATFPRCAHFSVFAPAQIPARSASPSSAARAPCALRFRCLVVRAPPLTHAVARCCPLPHCKAVEFSCEWTDVAGLLAHETVRGSFRARVYGSGNGVLCCLTGDAWPPHEAPPINQTL